MEELYASIEGQDLERAKRAARLVDWPHFSHDDAANFASGKYQAHSVLARLSFHFSNLGHGLPPAEAFADGFLRACVQDGYQVLDDSFILDLRGKDAQLTSLVAKVAHATNSRDSDGNTLAHLALIPTGPPCLVTLRSSLLTGMDPNTPNRAGQTPLHLLWRNDEMNGLMGMSTQALLWIRSLELLLGSGAREDIADAAGTTPLQAMEQALDPTIFPPTKLSRQASHVRAAHATAHTAALARRHHAELDAAVPAADAPRPRM